MNVHEALVALMETRWPEVEPSEKRSRPMRGDDAAVDRRDDERSALDEFIDMIVDAGYTRQPQPHVVETVEGLASTITDALFTKSPYLNADQNDESRSALYSRIFDALSATVLTPCAQPTATYDPQDFRASAVTLNTVGWKIARALGKEPGENGVITTDIEDDVDRLIDRATHCDLSEADCEDCGCAKSEHNGKGVCSFTCPGQCSRYRAARGVTS